MQMSDGGGGRLGRARGAVAAGRHAVMALERAREAAAVVEASSGRDLADHHRRGPQQKARPLQTQTHRQGLRTLVVERMERFGEVPAREAGEVGQLADADDAVAVAFQIQARALHAPEDLTLAQTRPAGTPSHTCGEIALYGRELQQQRPRGDAVVACGGSGSPQTQ